MKRLVMPAVAVTLAAFVWYPQGAAASDVIVTQKKMQFLLSDKKVETLTIKVGDTISFVNEDTMVHNVFSRKPRFRVRPQVAASRRDRSTHLQQGGNAGDRMRTASAHEVQARDRTLTAFRARPAAPRPDPRAAHPRLICQLRPMAFAAATASGPTLRANSSAFHSLNEPTTWIAAIGTSCSSTTAAPMATSPIMICSSAVE